MHTDALIEVLKELIRRPSVVGSEDSFFRYLRRVLEERGATVTQYEGLLVANGSEPTKAMFSAHIDRHGLLCTGPDEFQYAAFVAGNRSDLLGNSVSEQLMTKVADRFDDVPVMAYEAWSGSYLGAGRIRRGRICEFRNNLVFDVEGLSHVVAGTPVAFADRLKHDSEVLSGQLDNVICAAALVALFELGFTGTTFFTAEEEAGKSWRYLLEWFRRFGGHTESLVVLDTSPFPGAEAARNQDVVLRRKDANGVFAVQATRNIEEVCTAQGIRYMFKDEYVERMNRAEGKNRSLGSTELGRIVAASNGWVQGTTLQIPTYGYHTMEETATLSSCDAFMRVLLELGKGTAHLPARP